MNLELISFVLLGLSLLLIGANYLVQSIVELSEKLKISKLIVATCTLAFGTTIPELATSLNAILIEPSHPAIAIGNIIGSNIANIFLILGVASLINPIIFQENKIMLMESKVNLWIIFFPISIMIFSITGPISQLISIFMIIFLFLLFYKRIRIGKIENSSSNNEKAYFSVFLMLILSLLSVLYGSKILINSSINIAQVFGVSERFIGLSLVAIGTSLPELTTAIIASLKKLNDIAIGNVLGANTYNLLGILSIVEIIEPSSILKYIENIDIYYLMISTFLLIFFIKKVKLLNRGAGFIFLLSYISYIYLVY